MHYGHPLEFGTFITPRSDSPESVVALARRSEELGYDLVTFQDHPYQPAHLDTWTLLSWVAGQTERIRIAANVHNIQLRDPTVLARSAASLDLLSGGRLSLGLGAGAYQMAVAAMGGRGLRAGQAVEALEAAIDIIRGILDTADSAPLSFHGTYYRVSRVQRGPVPAHDIPIWIGARQPRMLRLIGRKADGWLPSLPFLQPGDLTAGNAIIDEAAREAGRDPREIRRLVNIAGRFAPERGGFLEGPSVQWVEELLPLVVEHGVGTFILMSDDERTIEQFAREVAPALREAAERELAGAFLARPIRRASVRARRREGIDYDAIPESLDGAVIEPGDPSYARMRSTYFRGGSPGLVIQPGTTAEVATAVAFARAHRHVPLSIRSGGHGIRGRSTNDGGIVINLSRLRAIEVLDRATRRVRIEPGARWMDVAAALSPYGWALTSGDYGGVGVGGLATAGGIGFLGRKHGLTIDHLRAVEMVLADGAVVRASDDENPDLFWAVRGAGAGFGIVTSFEFEVPEVSNVGWAQLLFDASDIAGFLERWGAIVEASPRELTSFLITSPRRGQPTIAFVLAMVASDNPETIVRCLQPLVNIAPLYDQSAIIAPYATVMANAQSGDYYGRGEPITRSGLIEHITPEFAADAERLLRSGLIYFFQIRAAGGAVSDVPPDATAYANRSANFSVLALGAHRARLDAAWDQIQYHFNGLYLAFETDPRPERLAEAFPPPTLERLRRLKARYDPENLFRDSFDLNPEDASRPAPVETGS